MKTDDKETIVERSGELKSSNFGVKNSADMVHIFGILRSKLYSNKILAFIREYSTNAFDEHIASGCREKPIQVTLPTVIEPVFKIRDFGRGLSEEGIRETYCMYGRSTKRDSNEYNGQMGFGSKSAFAYTDLWQISSYHDGVCSHYSVYIDETGLGEVTLMSTSPTESTGIEISIPIERNDITAVVTTAMQFYRYFEVTPKFINGKANFPIETSLWEIPGIMIVKDNGYANQNIFARMGNVLYPVDTTNFFQDWRGTCKNPNYALSSEDTNFLSRNKKIIMDFGIGELQISASRESLEYKEKTLKAIKEKLQTIRSSIIADIHKKHQNEPNLRKRFFLLTKTFAQLGLDGGLVKSNTTIEIDGLKFGAFVQHKDLPSFKAKVVSRRYSTKHGTYNYVGEWAKEPEKYLCAPLHQALVVLDDFADKHGKESLNRVKTYLNGNSDGCTQAIIYHSDDIKAFKDKLFEQKIPDDFIIMASSLPEPMQSIDDEEEEKKPVHRIDAAKRKAKMFIPSGMNETSAKSKNWTEYTYDAAIPTYFVEIDSFAIIGKVLGNPISAFELKADLANLVENKILPEKSVVIGVRTKDLAEVEALLIPRLETVLKEWRDKNKEKAIMSNARARLDSIEKLVLDLKLKLNKPTCLKEAPAKKLPSAEDYQLCYSFGIKDLESDDILKADDLASKFDKEVECFRKDYPLLFSLDSWQIMRDKNLINHLVDYIQAIDKTKESK